MTTGEGQDEGATPADSPDRTTPSLEPARRRPAGWALGLPALALLCVVAILRTGPAVERDIRRELVRIAGSDSASPLARYRARTEVDGRDVAIVADLGLSDDLRLATEERVRRVRGIRSVRTAVAAPVTLSPFTLAIRRSPAGFVLSGGVPSAEARGALVEQAARLSAPDLVEDRLSLATPAPPGFEAAAAFLLAALGTVEQGEAILSDRRFAVRAAPPDRATYRALLAALSAPPPSFRPDGLDILPPLAAPYGWSARRDAGGFLLAGHVPSEEARAALARFGAEMLPGLPVRDEMDTARGLARGVPFDALARAALAALASVQAGRAELDGNRFSFAGDTVAKAELAAIAERIRASLPAGVEAGPIALRAVPVTPFVFTARRAGGEVVLSGYVPGEPERRAIAGLVGSRFPGERLVDRLTVADGAPSGLPEVARGALDALADFAEGEAVIRDRDLRLDGRILYDQLAQRVRRTAGRLVPEGWTASAAVEGPPPVGALDPIQCGDLLADAARKTPIRFAASQSVPSGPPGSAGPAGSPLDATADIVRRCGRVAIRVVHVIASGPNPDAAAQLATERAQVLAVALGARGATARLVPEGVVARTPAGPGASAADQTDFVVGAP